MGDETFSTSSYKSTRSARYSSMEHITAAAEQQAYATGRLSPLVDPAHDPIRRSLMRFNPTTLPDGTRAWVVTVGPPMPIESNIDTTGSMGGNVDLTMNHLPHIMSLLTTVLPSYDLHYAPGIFGDVSDRFVFQRGQFEMTAAKLVETLGNMVPERDGGDITEDPHYGIFGAAYLTHTYINRIGLKGYHFTVSDAPTRRSFSLRTLRRVFGDDVLTYVQENGYAHFSKDDISNLDLKDVVADLSTRTHAFFLYCNEFTFIHGPGSSSYAHWYDFYDPQHLFVIPSTEYLPQAQAALIGLTEGTLDPQSVRDFLADHQIPSSHIDLYAKQFRAVDLGAGQRLVSELPHPLPQPGDIFLNKTDLWPAMDLPDVIRAKAVADDPNDPTWL